MSHQRLTVTVMAKAHLLLATGGGGQGGRVQAPPCMDGWMASRLACLRGDWRTCWQANAHAVGFPPGCFPGTKDNTMRCCRCPGPGRTLRPLSRAIELGKPRQCCVGLFWCTRSGGCVMLGCVAVAGDGRGCPSAKGLQCRGSSQRRVTGTATKPGPGPWDAGMAMAVALGGCRVCGYVGMHVRRDLFCSRCVYASGLPRRARHTPAAAVLAFFARTVHDLTTCGAGMLCICIGVARQQWRTCPTASERHLVP